MMTRREKRKRAYINKDELLASLIGDHLLTREARDKLRAARVPSGDVIRLTTPDHNELHALGGSDAWWNLTIRLRGPELKAKDNRDTSIVAKTDRVSEGQREHLQVMARKLLPASPFLELEAERNAHENKRVRALLDATERRRNRWAQGRKLQGGNSFQRRQPCK